MKIMATVVLGFIVMIAAVSFLSCIICAPSGMSGADVVVALVSLAVMIGGIFLIAALHKSSGEPREPL